MSYTVTGFGVGRVKLKYEKETLSEAGYLASKMADNGVADVHIADASGREVSLEEGWDAFRQSPPPGWTVR